MTVFVAHEQNKTSDRRARAIVFDLQSQNPSHCFVPESIAFRHLYDGDFSDDVIFEIECDLLCNCDQLLIVSDLSPVMRRQIDFARKVGMEVIDLADKYRTI